MSDLFPEVVPDKLALLRRRTWARHQHNRIVDPNDNERYTLRPTLELCMRLAGVDHIDIDTAACPEAHCAPLWLGQQGDGSFLDALTSSWDPCAYAPVGVVGWLPVPKVVRRLAGPLVGWCNPPYDALEDFTERSTLAMLDGELDVLLSLPPGDRCEQPWWQEWIEPSRDGRGNIAGKVRITTHPLPGRQKFGSPGDPCGLVASSAPFPSVLIVWRRE